MSLRLEFVALAQRPGANVSALCRAYGISRKTGYKWLGRAVDSMVDRSRRPHTSPRRTPDAIEHQVLQARDVYPDWGARKLKRFLENHGASDLPAVSTITAVLHRHGRISPEASTAAEHWQRFEHPQPNALWQMDFKGHFAMQRGRCHALTVLDDHSRFNLVLHACEAESFEVVQPALTATFRRYGLPWRISCDNGSPWGSVGREDRLTRLGAWLIRLGIRVSHARVGHPQTNGKDERFHRTLKRELLRHRVLADLNDAQHAFDRFRELYNTQRPHDALGLNVPLDRFRPSERAFPEVLPAIDYDDGLPLRTVDSAGNISFRNRRYRVSKALKGLPVALRLDPDDDHKADVIYCQQSIRTLDLRTPDNAS
jgi:transposase InsO family protein